MSTNPSIALPAYHGRQGVTQAAVLRSEWVKLRSLRSSVWALLTAASLMVAASLLFSTLKTDQGTTSAAGQPVFDPTAQSLGGVVFAQVAVAVLGVLLFTGEYGTGMVRVSFAAVPRRLPVLWGKAGAFAAATFTVSILSAFASFFAGQAVLNSKHLGTTLGQPGVARAVLGAALLLTVTGLLGLGIGAVLRNTAASISTVLSLLLVVPIVVAFLPSPLSERIGQFLPVGGAGTSIINVKPPQAYVLAPWTGLAVFALYAALALALGAWQIRSRDA
jgi:ABC-type transport system involved in multi-copper enzyme maturation permease subunit